MTHYITLEEGHFGWEYVIVHDDGRDLLVQSDWEYPGLAMTFGWSPCAWCRRSCNGASDGTIPCHRRSVEEHIAHAKAWLDRHLGKRVVDPGSVEEISAPCDPNLIIALYYLAYEHHSGQWSRGYRLLCRVQRYARKHGIDLHHQTRASRHRYWQLAARYSEQL